MNAPQLFQGIRAELTVAESPRERDRTTGARPRRSKPLLNVRPGSMMAMYWTAVTMLVATVDPMSVATSPPLERTRDRTGPNPERPADGLHLDRGVEVSRRTQPPEDRQGYRHGGYGGKTEHRTKPGADTFDPRLAQRLDGVAGLRQAERSGE